MQNKKSLLYIILAFVAGMFLMYLFSNYKIEKKNENSNQEISYQKSENKNQDNTFSYDKSSSKNEENYEKKNNDFSNSDTNIEELTKDDIVVKYVKEHGELPDYYITKSEAKREGWNPGKGNLCEVLPGRAIGGDIWTNRQKSLPTKSGRQYYEADLNYNCGNRNADRIVFSNDGLVFVTFDHYRSFEER